MRCADMCVCRRMRVVSGRASEWLVRVALRTPARGAPAGAAHQRAPAPRPESRFRMLFLSLVRSAADAYARVQALQLRARIDGLFCPLRVGVRLGHARHELVRLGGRP